MAGELSSLLLGESMRRGGGRDDPGTSLDDRGSPGKGEKLPGARPWDRPDVDVVGCILADWHRGSRYILTVPERIRRGDSGVVATGLDVALRPSARVAADCLYALGT